MLRAFLAGFFIFNGLPHLFQGISGKKHMTPFKRVSSPLLNVVWAFTNLAIGVLVLGFKPNGALNSDRCKVLGIYGRRLPAIFNRSDVIRPAQCQTALAQRLTKTD